VPVADSYLGNYSIGIPADILVTPVNKHCTKLWQSKTECLRFHCKTLWLSL